MLTFDAQQFATLEKKPLQAFEDRVYRHLSRWRPQHCAYLGEAQMRVAIRRGWERARHYGLEPECCVLSYVDLTCLLGAGFDSDPLLGWAGTLLNEQPRGDPIERADRLHDLAWDYIAKAARDYRDDQGKPITDRLVVLFREVRAEAAHPLTRENYTAFADSLTSLLWKYFPAKRALVDDEVFQQFIANAVRRAREHSIVSLRGTRLVAILMFVLGDGFDDDPMLPWVKQVLGDAALADPEQRVEQLFSRGAQELRRWWDLNDSGQRT